MRHVREACQGAVEFDHVADGDNALGGVGATAVLDSAELVVSEAVQGGE